VPRFCVPGDPVQVPPAKVKLVFAYAARSAGSLKSRKSPPGSCKHFSRKAALILCRSKHLPHNPIL
jgi:hypothetical protein